MIGGLPGNNPAPLLPDGGQEPRLRRVAPAVEGDPRASDRPSRERGQTFNAEVIQRRVESLSALENGRLQTLDPQGLPLRNQQALATFAAVAAGTEGDESELVGLDLRV